MTIDGSLAPGRPALSVLALIGAATGLALISMLQSALWLDYGGAAVPWLGLLKARLGEWYIYALLFPPLLVLARRLPIGAAPWRLVLPLYAIASLLLPVIKEELFVLLGNWFRPGAFHLGEILAEDYASEVFTFWALVAVAHALPGRQARDSSAAPSVSTDEPIFVVHEGALRRSVAPAEVGWIDAQGNYARLNTGAGRYLVRETMAGLERRLAPHFIRVHRATLVRVEAIARVERRARGALVLVLDCGAVVAVGRSYRAVVRRLHG